MRDTTIPVYGYLTPDGGFTFECWFSRLAGAAGTQAACLLDQRTQATVTWVSGTPPVSEVGRHIWFGFDNNASDGFALVVGQETDLVSGSEILFYSDPAPTGYQNDNQWHHVALTLDAATKRVFKIFLDGVLYTTQTIGSDLNWNPGIMTIAGALTIEKGQVGFSAYDSKLAYVAAFDKELTANKIFEHYTAGNSGTVFYGDDDVVRLNRIMDWSDVPPNFRLFEPAQTVLQGIQVADTNSLDIAQNTAEDAGGYLFADGQGIMCYHNRRHRYNRWAEIYVGETRDQGAAQVGMKFATYEKYVYNDIRGTRPFGTKVRLQNETSEDAHGRKVFSIEIAVTEHEELVNAVLWMLARYGSDTVRVSGVKFEAHNSILLKEFAYGRVEIGDMMVFEDLPDPAPTNQMEFVVEGITVEADFLSRTWTTELALSPHELNKVFQICTSTLTDGSFVGY